jgi:TonB family protein
MKYILAFALVVAMPCAVFADDSLSAARDLYASAAYEDALAMLGRLNTSAMKNEDGRVADQYRALCLLALGKNSEASQAIEAVVSADPAYLPSESDVSPRVRSVFSDVRRRLLPGLVQQKYALAKTAYDRKDYKTASLNFGQVLQLLDDPDLGPAAGKSPLSDLKVLADGFHQLSLQALLPPPAPEPPPAPAVAKPVAPAAPEPPKIYAAGDTGVVLPVIIRQELPPFAGAIDHAVTGVLEVVIDESGRVTTATMRGLSMPGYDRQAIAAAQTWRYRPATYNGAPVKFRKYIQVSLTPK